KMSNEQLANDKTRNDNLLGLMDDVKKLPPDQYAQQWPQIAQRAIQIKPELQGQIDPNKPIPQEQLGQFQLGVQAHSTIQAQVLAQRADQRAQAASQAQLPGMVAESALKQKQLQAANAGGAIPGVPLDTQEANSWLSAHPGKTLADFMKYKSTLVPQFNFNLQNTGTTGNAGDVAKRFGMSPVAFDQASEKYWT